MSAYFHSYLCGRKAAEWLIDMDNSSAGAIRNLQQRPHTGGWTAANRMWAFFFSEPERENPCVDDPHLDNPRVANPHRENPAQRNTK